MSIANQLYAQLPPKEHFVPPTCPNPKCDFYGKEPSKPKWCNPIKPFTRKNGEQIPRWVCYQSEKPHTFSYASFECTYWLKKRELLPQIAQALSEQTCLRGLARSFGVSQNCIAGQVARIGRHSLVLQQMALKSIQPKNLGTLIFDELESWEVSQFVPTTHPLFMDFESGFKLSLDCLPINRKGKMTSQQKRKYSNWVEKYGKSSKKNSSFLVFNGLERLRFLYEKKKSSHVVTDEKRSYSSQLKKAWAKVNYTHAQYSGKKDRHVGFMGKINQEDQYLRQRCSTMRRETLDFMRRHNNTGLRHAIYLIKRNFVMAESGSKRLMTPAVRLKLVQEPVSWAQVFSKRVIDGVSILPDYLKEIYHQRSKTSYYKNNYVHQPVFAI